MSRIKVMNNAPRRKRNDLVYYMHDGSAAFRFQLAGDLSQDTVQDLEQARQTASSVIGRRCLTVDLTDLINIDAAGRDLLKEWHALGAQLTVMSSEGQARIQLMTGVPITVVGTKPEASRWLPSRAAALLLAALLVLLLAATAASDLRQSVGAAANQDAFLRSVHYGMLYKHHKITRGERYICLLLTT
jgi:ABC-type transporter Mla MlaB component